ncbi:hypothetical protein PM082_009657 [Marasmius tenuissimus]|nr:hypothetical protein PM082_009657 [Marasmius tenuissimus]
MNPQNYTEAELEGWRRRFPCMGYWLGVHQQHPEIHGRPVFPQVPEQPPPPPVPQYHHVPNNPHSFQPPPPYNAVVQPRNLQPPLPQYHDPVPPECPIPIFRAHDDPPLPPPPPPHYRQCVHEYANHPPPEPPVQHRERVVTRVELLVPTESDLVGGTANHVRRRLEPDLPFHDWFSKICADMGLDESEAMIGYKFTDEAQRAAPKCITNQEQYEIAVRDYVEKQMRARTRTVVMQLFNLRQPSRAAAAAALKKNTAGRKRRLDDHMLQPSEIETKAAKVGEAIISWWSCSRHGGRLHWVDPLSQECVDVDNELFSRWVKDIVLDNATVERPPNQKEFDSKPKRARYSTANSSNPPVTVNLYNNPGPSTSSTSFSSDVHRTPLSDVSPYRVSQSSCRPDLC